MLNRAHVQNSARHFSIPLDPCAFIDALEFVDDLQLAADYAVHRNARIRENFIVKQTVSILHTDRFYQNTTAARKRSAQADYEEVERRG